MEKHDKDLNTIDYQPKRYITKPAAEKEHMPLLCACENQASHLILKE